MEQNETGLNEAGTSEILTHGVPSYSYPSTDFGSYEDSGSWPRSKKQAKHQVLSPSAGFGYRVVKRVVDLILAAVAMPILLPILFVLALLVKLTSPGPVFFSHRRICKSGAFFSMWKFRTMCVNSSEVLERYLAAHPEARSEWNQTHKLQDDPRVTRIGKVMRRLSLDELPQIWNVITGRMSLVGPRPIVAAEVEKYAECFQCYTRVKPGVTGLWQVSGRSKLSYEARVKLDCEYVANWSLWRDLKILLLTVRSVVNQDGAY
jgi:Undecaprenyl-phosphate galactose phosphotransferase WbaP